MQYHLLPMSQSTLQNSRTKPRCLSSDRSTVVYCLAGSSHFMCFLPTQNRWFSLAAPPLCYDQVEDNITHHARLLAANGLVYACVMARHPEEAGRCTMKALQKYDLSTNEWKYCSLPQGTNQSLFIECQDRLYAFSRDGVELYSVDQNLWQKVLDVKLTPCQFAMSDDHYVHLYNLENGIAQTITVGTDHQMQRTQVM